MLCVPDLMSMPPGEKLDLDMVKGGADGDDRPLRATGRPGGHPRPAARRDAPGDQGLADEHRRL